MARTRKQNGPDPVDVYVGERIRLRRTLMGLTQKNLGDRVGLTFQQVQKYERGDNRVSASTLYRIANVLDVPVSFFFDLLSEVVATLPPASADLQSGREALDLMRHYFALPNEPRRKVFNLVRGLAQTRW